jgi:predicted O-methyltransferase YrrM
MDSAVAAVIDEYEARARRERAAGGALSIDEQLLYVGPETALLMNTLIKAMGARRILELGTSYGYSTVWLAEAARQTGGKVVSLDVAPGTQAYAREKLAAAGLSDQVELVSADALEFLKTWTQPLDFVLVDLWKDLYVPCLELFFPRLAPGALVAADNMLRPSPTHDNARAYRRAVRAKPGIESVLLDIGSGIELSRLAAEADP